MADEEDAFGVGHTQFAADDVARQDFPVAIDFRADAPRLAVAAQAAAADLQGAQAFLQAFLERAADGHGFADAFHLRGERGVGLREFLEGKARNLGDDVINARLEARGGNKFNSSVYESVPTQQSTCLKKFPMLLQLPWPCPNWGFGFRAPKGRHRFGANLTIPPEPNDSNPFSHGAF